MNEEGSKELLKLGNSIVSKVVEIEKLDLLYDIRDFLGIIAETVKPYNYFETLEISVKEAHIEEKHEFPTTVYKITVMPIPVPFTLYIENVMRSENKYSLLSGESVEIERKCRKIYYSNDAYPDIEENIRLFIFGRW